MRCGARCRPRGRRWRPTAVHAACRGGRDCRLGAGHGEERTSNMRLMSVTLEVSKLSGWLKTDAPCRVERGGYTIGIRCGAPVRRRADREGGWPRAWGGGGASGAQGGARLKAGGQAQAAHPEHLPHRCDAGRVKAERLVKRRRLLPSRKESIRCEVRAGRREGREGREACWGVQTACAVRDR